MTNPNVVEVAVRSDESIETTPAAASHGVLIGVTRAGRDDSEHRQENQ